MTPTSRLFFAIEISSALRATIINTIQQLKKQNAAQQVRWIRPENWHLTICFLGTTQYEKIAACLESAEKALRTFTPFEFTLGQLCAFPAQHPRMLVIQILSSQMLIALHDALKNALIAAGFVQEKRAFFPHVTLGKFSSNLPVVLNEVVIPPMQQPVAEVVLFASKTAPEGSIYTVVQRLMF